MNLIKNKRLLIGVLLVAIFVVNISYSFFYKLEPVADARAYDEIAWNFTRGIGYLELEENIGREEIDNAIGRVGPGYEFFLAGIYTIFGHNVPVVWFIHALLRVLTTVLIILIARILFQENGVSIGIIAGIIYGFSPDLILIQAMLLTETLGVFLLVLSVYYSLRFFTDGTYKNIILLSSSVTLALLTRPTSVLVLLIVFFVLLAKKDFSKALILWVIPIMIIAPWAMRNYIIYDHLVLTSATGGYDLWVGNNLGATGGFDKTPEINEARSRLHITELDALGFKNYFSFIKDHPFRFIELQLKKTAIYFSLIRPTGFWSFLDNNPLAQRLTLISSALWTAIIFILGIAGAVVALIENKNLRTRLFIAFAIIQPITVIPVIVETRYRYVLFPFLAILGSYFIVKYLARLMDKERSLARSALYWSTTFIIALTTYDLAWNASEFLIRMDVIF